MQISEWMNFLLSRSPHLKSEMVSCSPVLFLVISDIGLIQLSVGFCGNAVLFVWSKRRLYIQDLDNCWVRYLFVEFNAEEVGVEGEGYIWRPEAESDDEFERTRDVWGKNLFGVLVDMLTKKLPGFSLGTWIDVCDSLSKENGMSRVRRALWKGVKTGLSWRTQCAKAVLT